VLGRMFGHEFHALLIFQEFLIADDFAALFGSGPRLCSNYDANFTLGLYRSHMASSGLPLRGRRNCNLSLIFGEG